MNRVLVTSILMGCIVLSAGCSDNVQQVSVDNAGEKIEQKSSLLLSSRKVKAQRLIPTAADLGDEWIEVEKEIVVEQILKTEGSGSTGASTDELLNGYSEDVVNSAGNAKIIARSVYSNYNVQEPVALSITWIVRGSALQPFVSGDLYTLNRVSGFTEWKLDDNGVAYAFPTGDIYPGVSNNMFEVKNPVAAYLAVDGCLVEVRVTSELPARDFTVSLDKVKNILGRNISRKIDGVENKPEDIKRYWDILQKIML